MSDNEIEDVSFLPGENLHRKAVYEPSIIQKLRLLLCNRTRLITIAIVGVLVVIVIGLIAALSHRQCSNASSETSVAKDAAGKTQDYIATDGRSFPYRNIRLPTNIKPLHYKIMLQPNISQSLFTGKVEILFYVETASDFLIFHIKDLNISQLSVKLTETGNPYTIVDKMEYKRNEQVYLKLDTELMPKTNLTLSVSFRGELSNKLAGFYKSTYTTKTNDTKYIATTHFEATDARAAFPCFDEPELKATFELSIIRQPEHISLFNMPLKSTSDYKGGLKQDNFQKSVKMSTYLVAFVVCDYKKLTEYTKRNVTVSVYAPEDSIDSADFAVKTATMVIDYYEDYFGVEYPLPKQDMIAIPDFQAGAMENWGLITYRMTNILYDPKVNSEMNKERVAMVVAHELAHQWFGNLVTMEWWDDLWLNEGFASYVEYLGTSIINPSWKMDEQFVLDMLLTVMFSDSLTNSHPINQPVHSPDEINELFDDITYHKGATIIRMLSNFLGDENFKAGLTGYLKEYQYSNAGTTDLWHSLSQMALDGKDVSSLMKTWTEQMGYPVVHIRHNGNRVVVTQSRFLLYKNASYHDVSSPFGYVWQIPFTYTTATNPQNVQKVLLTKPTEIFQLASPTGWLKANAGMFGYYRVNYEEDNWRKLTQQLHKKDHGGISSAERAGLLDDAFQLARAGLLNYTIALDLTLYMVNEESYLPWSTLLSNLLFLQMRIEKTPAFANYKAYLLTLMKKQLDSITWEDGGELLEKKLTASILGKAVYLGHEATVKKGRQLFEAWKVNKTSMNPNLKSIIYFAGIRHGSEADWQYVWDRYLAEHDTSEKQKLLVSLGDSQDALLLSRLLAFSLDKNDVKSQDSDLIIRSVSSSYTGSILAWRFVQQNWDVIFSRYGQSSFIMSDIISSVLTRFDTQFDVNEVESFFSSRDLGTGQRAVQQSLEKIAMNIDWLSKHESEVVDWFQKRGKVR